MTVAPDRPFAQRLGFESDGTINFPLPAQLDAAASPAPDIADVAGAAPGSLPRPEEIADLKPLGQVNSSFIVAVNGEGLWIIDQHVAHERVLFEQHLRARREGDFGRAAAARPDHCRIEPAAARDFRADCRGAARQRI